MPFSSVICLFLHFPLLTNPYLSSHCPYLFLTHNLLNSLLYQLYTLLPSTLSLCNPWQKHLPQKQPNYTLTHFRALLPYSTHTSHLFPPSLHFPFLPPHPGHLFNYLSKENI
jgi:hypothetical protein